MRLKFRDYYILMSLYGLLLWLNGLHNLVSVPRYEAVGGGRMVAGVAVALIGWMLLKSDPNPLGFIETITDRLINRSR